MPDAEDLTSLVRAAQRGDGLAIAELIDLLAPAVGRWCGPIALRDAQDAAQEALIAVFRGIKGLAEPAALFGWARSITVREALRVARRTAQHRNVELADLPARGDPLLAVDIADLLDVPPGTVKSRLARARDNFRKGWTR